MKVLKIAIAIIGEVDRIGLGLGSEVEVRIVEDWQERRRNPPLKSLATESLRVKSESGF